MNNKEAQNNETYQGSSMDVSNLMCDGLFNEVEDNPNQKNAKRGATGLFKFRHKWHFILVAVAVIVVLAAIVTADVVPLANRGDGKSTTPSEIEVNANFQPQPSMSPSEEDIKSPQPSTGGPSPEPSKIPTVNHAPTQSTAPTTDPRTVNIVSYLQDLTLSPSPLRYPAPEGSATLEEKALAWILDNDPAQLGVETEVDQHRLVQRYALATFWFMQDTQEPWFEGVQVGWMTAAHECDWNMIWCQNQTYSNNDGTLFTSLTVIQIDAPGKNIRGQLPNDLGLLSNLKSLDLRNDHLTGTIPTQIGQLNQLTYLSFNRNDLSGSIPDEISGLSKIRWLDLGFNQLNGTIPTQIGELKQLLELELRFNQLNGTIPTQIGQLNQLTFLSFRYNDLSGPIPK